MNVDEKIKELEERIQRNKEEISKLNLLIFKACAPEGYKSGTAYNDYDSIHGSRKEIDLFKYAEDRRRLEIFIEIDTELLNNLKSNLKLKDDVLALPNTKDKIIYLKDLGYNNTQISNLIGIGVRHVRRIVKKYYRV